MCIHIYIYIYIYVHVYIFSQTTCTCYLYIYIYTNMYMYMCIHICTSLSIYIYICMYVFVVKIYLLNICLLNHTLLCCTYIRYCGRTSWCKPHHGVTLGTTRVAQPNRSSTRNQYTSLPPQKKEYPYRALVNAFLLIVIPFLIYICHF